MSVIINLKFTNINLHLHLSSGQQIYEAVDENQLPKVERFYREKKLQNNNHEVKILHTRLGINDPCSIQHMSMYVKTIILLQ